MVTCIQKPVLPFNDVYMLEMKPNLGLVYKDNDLHTKVLCKFLIHLMNIILFHETSYHICQAMCLTLKSLVRTKRLVDKVSVNVWVRDVI